MQTPTLMLKGRQSVTGKASGAGATRSSLGTSESSNGLTDAPSVESVNAAA
jgi:hypothetical protein